jgi:BMFP domain-containing protein YqiC
VSDGSVTDEHILAGFANLHETITTGFDSMRKEMNERIGELEHRMLRRFDQVDERFDKVERRLDKVEGRLEKVEGRLEKVEGRLEKVEGRLEKVEAKLETRRPKRGPDRS